MSESTTALMERTALIVTAHLQNNPLSTEQVPDFIRKIHAVLAALDSKPVPAAQAPRPAVDPRKSVFPDYIICLEDGKRMKMLKRHLATSFNLTPEQYRAKWKLGEEYPMVAPRYTEARSISAKQNGLGNHERRVPKRAKG